MKVYWDVIEQKQIYFAWACVAELSRALVLGSSHFSDVDSSPTAARVQVSAEYLARVFSVPFTLVGSLHSTVLYVPVHRRYLLGIEFF